MARAPNEKVSEAYELYKKGYKLIEISRELDIPDGTVRRWKKTYGWDSERSQNNKERSNKKINKKNVKRELIADKVKAVIENTELNDRQRLFCIYYIEDFNATKAYKKAYDCSYATAKVEGCKNLKKPNIKKEIDRLTKECLEEQEVEAKLLNKRLFETYMRIAFADIGDYLSFGQEEQKVWKINEDGSYQPVIDPETGEQKTRKYNVVNLNKSEDVDTTIISEISEGKDGVKVKLHDKMKALEWIDKHYGEGTPEQKLRIDKLKGEVDKLVNTDKDKPIEILIKRKERD